MDLKIKKLIRNLGGTLSEPYPIGVDGVNVDLEDNMNLEEKIDVIEQDISDLQEEVDKKAVKMHASEDDTYGLGTEELYGHLKISDKYEDVGEGASDVAMSQKGMVDFIGKIQTYLKIFQVLPDEDNRKTILFSALNTGYLLDEETMRLIDSFYEVWETDPEHKLPVGTVLPALVIK